MFSTTNIHCTMYFLPCFIGIRKIAPRSGLGFGLGLVLELGSGAIFLEPCVRTCASTCTSTCTIFAVANFTKCNGPLKVH